MGDVGPEVDRGAGCIGRGSPAGINPPPDTAVDWEGNIASIAGEFAVGDETGTIPFEPGAM